MTTTEPTLADFQSAFEPIWSANADAPRLPEGFDIEKDFTGKRASMFARDTEGSIPTAAALALCCTTAMEIGAWWEMKDIKTRIWQVYKRDDGWVSEVQRKAFDDSETRGHSSLLSAYLAALVAMTV